MDHRIGDAVFNYSGQPGIIIDRKPTTGEFVIQPPAPSLKEVQKRGYINGLTLEQRQDFNAVMDKVLELQDPSKKVEELTTQIEEKRLGDAKARVVAKYLDAEKQHLMQTYNIRNREYLVDEFRLGE